MTTAAQDSNTQYVSQGKLVTDGIKITKTGPQNQHQQSITVSTDKSMIFYCPGDKEYWVFEDSETDVRDAFLNEVEAMEEFHKDILADRESIKNKKPHEQVEDAAKNADSLVNRLFPNEDTKIVELVLLKKHPIWKERGFETMVYVRDTELADIAILKVKEEKAEEGEDCVSKRIIDSLKLTIENKKNLGSERESEAHGFNLDAKIAFDLKEWNPFDDGNPDTDDSQYWPMKFAFISDFNKGQTGSGYRISNKAQTCRYFAKASAKGEINVKEMNASFEGGGEVGYNLIEDEFTAKFFLPVEEGFDLFDLLRQSQKTAAELKKNLTNYLEEQKKWSDVVLTDNIKFNLDSAVPAISPEAGNCIDAIVKMVTAYRSYQQSGLDRKLVIHGHTDRSGPAAYNKALSQKRADCVKALIEGNVDAWTSIATEKSRVDDCQESLIALCKWFDGDYHPGEADNTMGQKTKDAIINLKRDYNEKYYKQNNLLPGPLLVVPMVNENNEADEDFWKIVFNLYRDKLCEKLSRWTPGTMYTAAKGNIWSSMTYFDYDATKSIDIEFHLSRPTEAWGETSPKVDAFQDDKVNLENRRIEFELAGPEVTEITPPKPPAFATGNLKIRFEFGLSLGVTVGASISVKGKAQIGIPKSKNVLQEALAMPPSPETTMGKASKPGGHTIKETEKTAKSKGVKEGDTFPASVDVTAEAFAGIKGTAQIYRQFQWNKTFNWAADEKWKSIGKLYMLAEGSIGIGANLTLKVQLGLNGVQVKFKAGVTLKVGGSVGYGFELAFKEAYYFVMHIYNNVNFRYIAEITGDVYQLIVRAQIQLLTDIAVTSIEAMQDGSEFVLMKIEEACDDVVDMVEDGVDALVMWWDKVVEKKNEKVAQLIKAIETSYND
ncbi:MAG: hypothetical protein OCC49_17680, partial [Fibrobacterales bacterium]